MHSKRPSHYRLLMLSCLVIIFLCLLFEADNRVNAQPQQREDKIVAAGRLFQEGIEAYRAQQLAQAIAKLKQANQLDPQSPNVRLVLGLMLYQQDSASVEAQQFMELAAPQFPNNTELQLKLLDSYLQHKNEKKLSPFLNRLQNTIANNNRLAFDIAYTLVRYEQLDLAQSQLDKVLAGLQPKLKSLTEQDLKLPANQAVRRDVGEANFISGMIAVSQNKKSDAMRLFQVADRYDFPASDSVQMQMLAESLFRMEEYPLSIQAYEAYLKNAPQDTEARMRFAISYYFQGLFAKAKDNFQRVFEEVPQTLNIHLYLGLSLLELKNNEEARKQFHEELKVNPQSYQAMAKLGYLDYLSGNNEGCRQWLEKAQVLNADWIETNMTFGLLYNRLGQFDKAIKVLEQAIKANPNYYKAHFQLAMAYRRSGDEAKAKEYTTIYDRLLAEEKSRQLGDKEPKD